MDTGVYAEAQSKLLEDLKDSYNLLASYPIDQQIAIKDLLDTKVYCITCGKLFRWGASYLCQLCSRVECEECYDEEETRTPGLCYRCATDDL